MKIPFLVIILSILLAGCNFEAPINPNELTEPLIVENAAVGWKIEVPAGWILSEKMEAQESSDKGVEMFEETLDREIDLTGEMQLLNISKYDVNTFTISATPFLEEYINEWRVTHEYWREAFVPTYLDQGIIAEISPITTVNISGIEFITHSSELTKPDDDKLVKQNTYSTLINGFDFSASMTYIENELKDEMMSILESSEFEIREIPDSLAAFKANLESAYNSYITNGDQAFDQMKYGEAMFWYEKAYNLNPLEQYAADKFVECERLADDASETEYQVLQSYQKIMEKADALFNEQDYNAALSYYERALGFQPENHYAKDRIILIKETILKMDYPEDWKPE